jgi:hypothetical protein
MDRECLLQLLVTDLAVTKAINDELEALLEADEAALWDGRAPSYGTYAHQRHEALAARLTQQNEQTIGGYFQDSGGPRH